MIKYEDKDITAACSLIDKIEVAGIENIKRLLLIATILGDGKKEEEDGSN